MASGRRIAVALSGGVDSTVAALLLREQGHKLVGVYMRNWDEKDETGVCLGEQEWSTVQSVCQRLKIDCIQVNFVKEYWNNVFTDMIDKYRRGITPSPDLLCNREIKFGSLLDYCRNQLGVEKLATGHYARLRSRADGEVELLRGVDLSRDQTYFLSTLQQQSLQHTVFPLGERLKSDIYKMARAAGFEDVAAKRESRGLCYVGKRDFSRFLREYIEPQPGPIALLDGTVVGEHGGVHTKTVGQRVGFRWASRVVKQPSPQQPTYVCHRDVPARALYVVPGVEHAALYPVAYETLPATWVSGRAPPDLLAEGGARVMSIPRYQSMAVKTRLSWTRDVGGGLHGSLADGQFAITPGQTAVFYDGDVCLGSAEFERVPLPEPYVAEPLQEVEEKKKKKNKKIVRSQS